MPADRPERLHGVQLWVALPPEARLGGPSYEHHVDLPVVEHPGATVTVVLGEHAGARSPGTTFTPLVGLDVDATGGEVPLDEAFEHAALALGEGALVEGTPLPVGTLLHLGTGRSSLQVDGRVLVLGGEPFGEPLVVWWNFVAASGEEVAQAREDWESGSGRFGTVRGYDGEPLSAPPLGPARLLPRS